jgi:hypothetical protein
MLLSDPTPSFDRLTRLWLCRAAALHVFVKHGRWCSTQKLVPDQS